MIAAIRVRYSRLGLFKSVLFPNSYDSSNKEKVVRKSYSRLGLFKSILFPTSYDISNKGKVLQTRIVLVYLVPDFL